MSLLNSTKMCSVLKRACRLAGGQKQWGELHGYSQSMVSMMISGKKRMPVKALEALGFVAVVRYRRVRNEG